MIKYIRTPFTIFEVVEETNVVYRVRAKWTPDKTYSKSKCQTDVIKQANTIEELCDEFVILDNRPPKSKRLEEDFDKAFRWFNQCKTSKQDIIIYGAIWTDKGLIYVAKMNDKGELELL